MKKWIPGILVCTLFALTSCNESTEEYVAHVSDTKMDVASFSGQQVQSGQLIVKLKRELSSDMFTRVSGIDIHKIERIFPHAGKFEERSRAVGLHLWYVVEYDKSVVTTRAAEELSLLDDVLVIEPVIPIKRNRSGTFKKLYENDRVASEKNSGRSIFNDPYIYAQWNFENTGEINHAIKGADIRLFDAWKFTTGHSDVIVSVVDGGIDYDHEDLSGNIWINTAELNGVEGVDDDNNGYKDDVYGYNFVTGKAIEPTLHGTHVAGIIGAMNNNNVGVSGIAGGDGTPNSGVRLMNCQIFLDNAEGEQSATNYYTAAAIKYGADNGAVISQNSWGFDLGTVTATPQIVQEAIAYFIANAGIDEQGHQVGPMKGGLVIFAAGNDKVMIPTYPASDDNVISVAAMGPDYKKATYSNYGSTINIMAPGGEISHDPVRARTGILSTGSGWDGESMVKNAYYYMDGTSMACPHVSGVAALLISKYGVEQPGFTPEKLKEMLYTTVYSVFNYNPEYQGMLGIGVLDASKAFTSEESPSLPPRLLRSLPNPAFTRIGDSQTIVLNDYFVSDTTDGELTYRVSTATSGIVLLELAEDVLKISTTGYGKVYVTVTVIDANDLETETTFLVSCYSKTVIPAPERPGFWGDVNDVEF